MVHWTANKLASEDSIQLASYNYKLNTRAGLALTNKTTPFLRIYRMEDEEHFSDRDFRDDPNWILHFVIDHATQDISLKDEVLSTETDL